MHDLQPNAYPYSKRDTCIGLWILLLLFVFRVGMQFIQWATPVHWLPDFNTWQSGVLPYPVLLTSQLVIIGAGIWSIACVSNDTLSPHREGGNKIGKVLTWVGLVYFCVMLSRVVAGLTIAQDHQWLNAPLPALFHLVLAGYLTVLGLYLSRNSRIIVARIAYPIVVSLAIIFFFLLREFQVGIPFAAITPVLLAATVISVLELNFPYRRKWKPECGDVLNDMVFMVIVQNLLPRMLGFLVALALLQAPVMQSSLASGLWPHGWSIFGQLLLMLITVEFMRYWLHRLSHNWNPLWRFHAVHHSSKKLYWANVGRFHPLEKIVQYVFDALPFILLGVPENVLALYFVFYAVNGFFQHCNIDLKLGFLNYIVSGPELHRWHHSRQVAESNNNYGNNLIVWDLVFGTWYLPCQCNVGELGLINRNYPMTFIAQMATPFVKGLDKHKGEIT